MKHPKDQLCVAFRVDASSFIGTGHVMRCLVLANELRDIGARTIFICRAHNGHLAERILRENHEVILLPVDPQFSKLANNHVQNSYGHWLGANTYDDARDTARELTCFAPSWLVIDHFAIDSQWEKYLKEYLPLKIMVIDGMANRAHVCNLLLDQTYSIAGASRWKSLVPNYCRLLVGPQFALLRPEFIIAQQSLSVKNCPARKIFVAFGGIDAPNASLIALDAIAELNMPDLVIEVVIGKSNLHRKSLEKRCLKFTNAHIRLDPPNIAEIMSTADVAISAGGGVLLELCFMQIPTIVVSIAENQVGPARALNEIGAVAYAGNLNTKHPEITKEAIYLRLIQIINSREKMTRLAEISKKIMDRSNQKISQLMLNI